MSSKRTARPHGQIRQSQMVTTFGPGSMLDLPNHSVLIGGLEYWSNGGEEIQEPRLVNKLKMLLNVHELKLKSPPPDLDDPTVAQTGVSAWQFPEWFITQDVQAGGQQSVRARFLVHRKALSKWKFVDAEKKRRSVVPIRFVRACRAGHISDIDWRWFVHEGTTECRRQLSMEERGTSADLSEVWVTCECGAARTMIEAATPGALGMCNGARPWLGPDASESCEDANGKLVPSKLLIRTASNAYFPQLLSVISLPDRDETISKAVDRVWQNFLEYVESIDELKNERAKKPPVRAALDGLSDNEVFTAIQARRGTTTQDLRTVKQAELETLTASKEELGNDRPGGDFYARSLPREIWERPWMSSVERIVLVHRLREVVSLAGFTRFEAAAPDVEGELDVGVSRASVAREISWLPAIENKGEGVFIQFKRHEIEKWANKPAVKARQSRATSAFERWAQEHPGTNRKCPPIAYTMLHSFSHMLITAVALECGYPASAIRERIYAIPNSGYGVLLYTGTSDAEGTLGGLVEVGRRLHEHVRDALESAELCSNDPVCAEHDPENAHEARYLHGAACHGCLLIAETSCEQHNDFLDRSLVISTVTSAKTEFFLGGYR